MTKSKQRKDSIHNTFIGESALSLILGSFLILQLSFLQPVFAQEGQEQVQAAEQQNQKQVEQPPSTSTVNNNETSKQQVQQEPQNVDKQSEQKVDQQQVDQKTDQKQQPQKQKKVKYDEKQIEQQLKEEFKEEIQQDIQTKEEEQINRLKVLSKEVGKDQEKKVEDLSKNNELSEQKVKELLDEAAEKLKNKKRGRNRFRDIENVKQELAEIQIQVLQKEKELQERDDNIQTLREQLELERKLRALLTKEKEKSQEEADLAMGLCFGAGSIYP